MINISWIRWHIYNFVVCKYNDNKQSESESEVGQSHWVHCEKGPAEALLPSPAEEVQPATGAAETVLLCHH